VVEQPPAKTTEPSAPGSPLDKRHSSGKTPLIQ
jgi:hypothetical protein